MADSSNGGSVFVASTGKANLACRYYLSGACNQGSECKFLHDKSGKARPDNICRYYQLGQCSYDKRCRYDHVKINSKKHQAASQVHQKPKTPHVPQPPTKAWVNTPETQSKTVTMATPHVSLPPTKASMIAAERQSKMVTLKKGGCSNGTEDVKVDEKKTSLSIKWAEAKEFVPGQKYLGCAAGSYAEAIGSPTSTTEQQATSDPWNSESTVAYDGAWGGFDYSADYEPCVEGLEPQGVGGLPDSLITEDTPLCPYYAQGRCPYSDDCQYAHGDLCEMCGMPRLHPKNAREREQHEKECVADQEKEMEKAFALQASEGKECGICLEDVIHKQPGKWGTVDRRFGILENCSHCFCLTCIRQWRGNEETSIETHRACPTCRAHSHFVIPSEFWITNPEEKKKLIQEYKSNLGRKECMYFKKGKGECPFNNKCFYMHALEDGTIVEGNLIQPRWQSNAEGEWRAVQDDDVSLWEFINQRDSSDRRRRYSSGMWEDLGLGELLEVIQSEESDWS